MVSPVPRLICRQIDERDFSAVATLLTRGFQSRTREFWLRALAQLTAREPPLGLPKYGYLIESDGAAVGVIVLICSTMLTADSVATRCNLSSWYVEPAFRAYAPLLVSHALQHKDVTYLNTSPAPATQPIIEAQGFSRYCDGTFIAVPMLNGLLRVTQVKVFGAHRQPEVDFDPFEREILLRHAAYGCISLWCATSKCAHPFVFRPRLVKAVIPCAQMIYCRNIAEFVRFAGPIGRFLAVRGRPLVLLDANGPVPRLVGAFRRGWMPPKYFKGPQRPRLGDLAYTEDAVLGV
jgi:hypothetical protein